MLFLRIVSVESVIPMLVLLEKSDMLRSSAARAGRPFPSKISTTIIAFVPAFANGLLGRTCAESFAGAPLMPTVLTVVVLLNRPPAEAVMFV